MEIKRISDLFWKVSPNTFFISLALGVATGLCYSLLIPFLMYAIGTNPDMDMALGANLSYFYSPTAMLAIVFLLACFLIITTKGISTVLAMYVANKASVEHRLYMYQRIQKMRLADLERIGQARLINIIKIDIPSITAAAIMLPQMWISMVTVTGILGYLVYLNVKVFGIVIACLGGAIISYQMPMIFATKYLKRARDGHDVIQHGINGLVYGAKELQLNHAKAMEFYRTELLTPERKSLVQSVKGTAIFIFTQCYGEILSFLVVSVVVFHLRYVFSMNSGELLGLAMALIYLAAPVGVILSVMGGIRQGKVSLKKLEVFYQELVVEPEVVAVHSPIKVDALQVRGLGYKYKAGQEEFGLRDIDLTFEAGEISFIVGGNGSGKSTLAKCLSLHYIPTIGSVSLGGTEIGDANRDCARQYVSAIFSDYFLFKKLYSRADLSTWRDISNYLEYLEISDKVSMDGDEFNTLALSDGQRRRLALLVLLLENRDVCIFDEWAADQDPKFKEIFYSIILRDLKLKNKVVIVITHDDRYFTYADQLISMENGTVVRIVRKNGVALAAEPAPMLETV